MLNLCVPTIIDNSKQIEELKKYSWNIIDLVVSNDKVSAAINRNRCIAKCKHEIIIMLDHDIKGFYQGWEKDLIDPLLSDNTIQLVSARLIDEKGKPQTMMGWGDSIQDIGWVEIDEKKLPSSCIAFRKSLCDEIIESELLPVNNPFDENYLKAEFEDTDFCYAISKIKSDAIFIVNNNCKLIHLNHETWRDESIRNVNRHYFEKKWNITT